MSPESVGDRDEYIDGKGIRVSAAGADVIRHCSPGRTMGGEQTSAQNAKGDWGKDSIARKEAVF
jgi:hypothetical protein